LDPVLSSGKEKGDVASLREPIIAGKPGIRWLKPGHCPPKHRELLIKVGVKFYED
jgi:hypothetical protein